MWRLYFLVERCYKLREPVLLVGETGGGKTTACQLLSTCLGSNLHILNCHQYTETSDFLGVCFLYLWLFFYCLLVIATPLSRSFLIYICKLWKPTIICYM